MNNGRTIPINHQRMKSNKHYIKDLIELIKTLLRGKCTATITHKRRTPEAGYLFDGKPREGTSTGNKTCVTVRTNAYTISIAQHTSAQRKHLPFPWSLIAVMTANSTGCCSLKAAQWPWLQDRFGPPRWTNRFHDVLQTIPLWRVINGRGKLKESTDTNGNRCEFTVPIILPTKYDWCPPCRSNIRYGKSIRKKRSME